MLFNTTTIIGRFWNQSGACVFGQQKPRSAIPARDLLWSRASYSAHFWWPGFPQAQQFPDSPGECVLKTMYKYTVFDPWYNVYFWARMSLPYPIWARMRLPNSQKPWNFHIKGLLIFDKLSSGFYQVHHFLVLNEAGEVGRDVCRHSTTSIPSGSIIKAIVEESEPMVQFSLIGCLKL